MSCLGCQLALGEIESQVVYENDTLTCLLDYNPYNEGHMLILPKRHVKELTACTDEEAAVIFATIKKLTRLLEHTLKPDGITVMQNGGIFDDLTHVHIHLIPRYKGQRFADFFIEEEADIAIHASSLPLTKQRLKDAIKGLD